jgi:hypothetical protein
MILDAATKERTWGPISSDCYSAKQPNTLLQISGKSAEKFRREATLIYVQ